MDWFRPFTTNLLIFYLWLFPFVYSAVITHVSPESFTVGMTRNLTVECWTSQEKNPNMAFLISVSLYHLEITNQSDFIHLASMNSFNSSVQVSDADKSTARYLGNIDNKEKSFLRVVWEYPKEDRAGQYKCEASGVNSMGKPLILSSTALVQAVQPVKEQIVDKIQILNGLVEKLQNDMNATRVLINDLNTYKEQTSKLQDDMKATRVLINDLNTFKDQTSSRQKLTIQFPFIPSPLYQGRRYWLTSRPLSVSPSVADLICKVYGGYLVEIDSDEEFRFVREHLVRKGLFHVIITGATDEKTEGVWINRHSGTQVRVLNWGTGEPNGGRGENCQSFRPYNGDWYMNDQSCHVDFGGFICEIPE